MGQLSRSLDTYVFLRNALAHFEVCARRAVEGLLGVPTMAPHDFSEAIHLSMESSMTCVVQAGNEGYSVLISLGMNRTDVADLLPGGEDEDMALDAVGEITNIMAGKVLGGPAFVETFGPMLPSTPLFNQGGTTLQKTWCIQGVLVAKAVKLFVGLTVKKNNQPKRGGAA